MNLSIEFKTPVVKGSYDWQLTQEINVSIDGGEVIAKTEIELLTMNKHRDAKATVLLLDEQEASDWEIPLHTYFKGQNISQSLCEELQVVSDTKAKTHIMIEAISVLAAYRKKAVASYILKEIANKYPKVQSITVLSMPMNWFVDPQYCETVENTAYYNSLDLPNETIDLEELNVVFVKLGFTQISVDEELLVEPLPYEIFVASPASIFNSIK